MSDAERNGEAKRRAVAAALIVAAAGWRLLTLASVHWANFSPVMALAFCGGVYFAAGWMWLVPFGALLLSDVSIDAYYAHFYHYPAWVGGSVLRMACVACGLGIGALVARRRNVVNLASGSLGSSLLFYFVTNTAAWRTDARWAVAMAYPQTWAGWWQAMTVGHPGLPPTLYFFRNTLASDLAFTAVFAAAMAWLARRRRAREGARASEGLLGRRL